MSDRNTVTGWIVGLAIVVLATCAAAAPQSIFSSGVASPLSAGPSDALPILVLADVGSWTGPPGPDGKLDLITADQSGVATLWYGNGDGTFKNSNGGIRLGRTPTALALGDFDNDGHPDLVITDTSGNLVFLQGLVDFPNFGPPGPPVAAGTGPVAVAAIDVNHDDNLDAIVLDNTVSGAAVTILLGDGHGGFTAGNTVGLPAGASAIAGVFSGDGNVALAVTNSNTSSVTILSGDGSGNFTAAAPMIEEPNGREPVAIAVGDVNKDGHPDLVVTNHSSDNIGVFLGQGNATFQAPSFFVSGTTNSAPNGLVLFDANGDGKLDVGVSNNFSFDVSVLLGDGTGNYSTSRSFVTDQEPLAVNAGDLNGDGIRDLVAVNRDDVTSDAVTLLGHGDGTFSAPEDVIVQATPSAAIAGDIDNDGLPDLIVAHPSGTLLVRRAQVGGGFAAPLTLQADGDAVAIGQGDFNSDGRLDIVALNQSTPNLSVFLGQASGFPSTPQNYSVGAGALALVVGDWDGNGRPDVAVARQASGASAGIDILLSNANGSLQAPHTITLASNPVAIERGDFNNDGSLDLALVSNTNTVTILLGNGNGTFQSATSISVPGATNNAKALAVADFDGDGFDDIAVVLAPTGNQVVVLYGDGHLGFTPGAVPVRAKSIPWAVAARDINGDLIPDLLIADQQANVVSPFISQGRNFVAAASVPASRGPVSMTAADFDGDGRYDAAAADNFVAGSVTVLTNIAATPLIRGDGNGDHKVTAADLVAVARKLSDGASTPVEQVRRGAHPVEPGADANGDGAVTAQDTVALEHRLFPRF